MAVRTRYAPSPTGKLHLGGLRTALYNFLFAKQNNGKFLLRIEDTDKNREVPGAIKGIIDDLNWAGIPFDEGPDKEGSFGPYIQSQRIPHYHHFAEELIKKGAAYRCFCSEERLNSLRTVNSVRGQATSYDRFCLSLSQQEISQKIQNKENHTIRLKVPSGQTTFEDIIRGTTTFNNNQIDDQILLKSDGFPTYHLACVVDDHLMQISHVIRGEEWISSTPKHVILNKALGFDIPKFAHLPLLLNENKSKLSKRQGDISVESFKQRGYLPDALINFIAFLGWTQESDKGSEVQEIFTKEELIKQFSLERVHKGGAVVMMSKLNWFNEHHLKKQANEDISKLIPSLRNFLDEKFGTKLDSSLRTDSYLTQVIDTIKERITTTRDIAERDNYFFQDPILGTENPNHKAMWKNPSEYVEIAKKIHEEVKKLDDFKISVIQETLKSVADKYKIVSGKVFTVARYLITGLHIGAPVPNVMSIIGKQTSLRRLEAGFLLIK